MLVMKSPGKQLRKHIRKYIIEFTHDHGFYSLKDPLIPHVRPYASHGTMRTDDDDECHMCSCHLVATSLEILFLGHKHVYCFLELESLLTPFAYGLG